MVSLFPMSKVSLNRLVNVMIPKKQWCPNSMEHIAQRVWSGTDGIWIYGSIHYMFGINRTMNKRKRMIKRRVQLLKKYKKSQGCQMCGYNDNPVALDFAHRHTEEKHIEMVMRRGGNGIDNLYRRLTLRDKVKNRFYIKELIAEIRKCDVLCKNCHAVETEKNREFQRNREISKSRGGSYKDRRSGVEQLDSSTLEEWF